MADELVKDNINNNYHRILPDYTNLEFIVKIKREMGKYKTWLKRGLIKRSFGKGTNFLVKVEGSRQAV